VRWSACPEVPDAAAEDAHARPRVRAGSDPRRWAAGLRSARTEGILPAPEPAHALPATIEEALRCEESGEEKVILTALCGHGLLDLSAYGSYQAGQVTDFDLPEQTLAEALRGLPATVG
jgi:tryptophan synthase beta chain